MNKSKRLQTIDGESLMSIPLTPLNFVVDTVPGTAHPCWLTQGG